MTKTESKTDWARVLAHKETDSIPYDKSDGPYDPNDAEAARAWLANATVIHNGKVVRRGKRGPQKLPTKKLVSLRLSPEVIAHFKASGAGWQTRIDDTLLRAIRTHADREQGLAKFGAELLEALKTRNIQIDPSELDDRSVMDILREKMAQR